VYRLLLLLFVASGCCWSEGCYPANRPENPAAGDDDDSAGDDDDSAGDDDDSAAGDHFELWFQVGCNLHLEESCQAAMALMDRAAKAGYTGVHFVAFKDNLLRDGQGIAADETNLLAVLARAEQLGLDMMKDFGVGGVGEGLLRADPNLAVGLPVTSKLVVSSDGTTLGRGLGIALVPDGGFEDWSGGGTQLPSWDWTDGGLSQDTTTVRPGSQGSSSLHIDLGANSAENKRAGVQIQLQSFHQYEVSFWAKTDSVAINAQQFGVHVKEVGNSSWRVWLGPDDFVLPSSPAWTKYKFTFNSLEAEVPSADGNLDVTIYVGAWGVADVTEGSLWLDDVTIRQAGLINLVRREGAPLTVEIDEAGVLVPLEEGVDFAYVDDPLLGVANGLSGNYDRWHEAPVIDLLVGGFHAGQKALVHHYAVERVYSYSVAPSMCASGVFDVLADHLTMLRTYYPGVSSFLLNYDEIRQANWGVDCAQRASDAGSLLAWHTAETIQLLRAQLPAARIYTWSDMFDPNHNAVADYYLVNGSFADSWIGLDPEVVVINWHGGAESFEHFETLGLKQLVSGNADSIAAHLDAARDSSGIVGAHFVNWSNDFTQLETFAEIVLGSR